MSSEDNGDIIKIRREPFDELVLRYPAHQLCSIGNIRYLNDYKPQN